MDRSRQGTRVELQAQVGELATGARLHLTVTAQHATTLRWVVVGTACATGLSLAALAAAAYAATWLFLGGVG